MRVHPFVRIAIVEDPAKLRQHIARGRSQVVKQKTQRLATLNDIVHLI